jgi:hypothetical protein
MMITIDNDNSGLNGLLRSRGVPLQNDGFIQICLQNAHVFSVLHSMIATGHLGYCPTQGRPGYCKKQVCVTQA